MAASRLNPDAEEVVIKNIRIVKVHFSRRVRIALIVAGLAVAAFACLVVGYTPGLLLFMISLIVAIAGAQM